MNHQDDHAWTWVSPRHDREVAARMAEKRALEAEEELGRALTPAELKDLHQQCRETVEAWGANARANADRQASK
jgi:hypothetical protein